MGCIRLGPPAATWHAKLHRLTRHSLAAAGAWGWADARCTQTLPYICREDQPSVYNYTSAKLGATYLMDTAPLNALAAEASCMRLGGHLVSYGSAQEQGEVEAAFIKQGALIPGYHGSYWIGLQASPYPQFTWLDK
jgi:hypothetical protein